MVKYVAAKLE